MAAILLWVAAALVATGVALYSIPAALVVAGVLLAALVMVLVWDWTPGGSE